MQQDDSRQKRFSDLPKTVLTLWAKSGPTTGYGLLCHMLDVAAVTETLLLREPRLTLKWLSIQLGLPVENVPRFVGSIAGLHDFGKATPGFEMKWPNGQTALVSQGLQFPRNSEKQHSVSTHRLLDQRLRERLGAGLKASVCDVLGAHHGVFLAPTTLHNALGTGSKDWKAAQAELFKYYWEALDPVVPAREERLSFAVTAWLAGLVSVADWIGSSEAFCPKEGTPGFGQRAETLQDHFVQARSLAEKVLEQKIRWPKAHSPICEEKILDEVLSNIMGMPASLRPLQKAGLELLDGTTEPVLMVVEAPMGEGKTELAFLSHLHLQKAIGHRGFYIALPTQATGNAMFKRAVRFLESQKSDTHLDIQLAHGGAIFNPDLIRLRRMEEDESESIASSAWFSQRRRPLLSPCGVGTVDQALFGILNVKHHFVRLFGLGNKVVVLDEVHAYDVYTSGLVCSLIRWLKALGASVVLMSATLPRSRREELFRAWGVTPTTEVQELPYPRIVVSSGGKVRGKTFAARPQASVRLEHVPEGIDDLASKARDLLAGGGCGAVIVNTVQRAQNLFLRLREMLPGENDLLLYHARFPAEERSHRERQVLWRFGKDGIRPERSLLVATQVAEQSLDVDFDFMLSDLAPVDLLLQRAGRLHRHDRKRPGAHAEPILWVAGLAPGVIPDLAETAWKFVYEEETLLRTWALLSCEEEIRLPEDIDRLVQAVYDGARLPDRLPEGAAERMAEARKKAEVKHAKHAQMARDNAVRVEAEKAYGNEGAYQTFQDADEDEAKAGGILALTRLGRLTVNVVPVHVDEAGTWRLTPEGETLSPDDTPDGATAACIWNRQTGLSRPPIPQMLLSSPRPPGWQRHPLLRGLVPLVLRNGEVRIGNTLVRLDDDLGIVYTKMEGA